MKHTNNGSALLSISSGFEPGCFIPQADVMTTAPRRKPDLLNFYIIFGVFFTHCISWVILCKETEKMTRWMFFNFHVMASSRYVFPKKSSIKLACISFPQPERKIVLKLFSTFPPQPLEGQVYLYCVLGWIFQT
jgi:hypothetical protein